MIQEAINTGNQMGGLPAEDGQPELTPKAKKDATNYQTLLNTIMHGKENRDNVVQLLASYKDPALSIPNAAMMITEQADKMGGGVPDEIKLGLSNYLVTDLAELGAAAKIWPKLSEEEMQYVYQDSVQDYISKGLKDKTIDPMTLQKESEPLMTDQQREFGEQYGQKQGIPSRPSVHGAISQMKLDSASKGQQRGGAI